MTKLKRSTQQIKTSFKEASFAFMNHKPIDSEYLRLTTLVASFTHPVKSYSVFSYSVLSRFLNFFHQEFDCYNLENVTLLLLDKTLCNSL